MLAIASPTYSESAIWSVLLHVLCSTPLVYEFLRLFPLLCSSTFLMCFFLILKWTSENIIIFFTSKLSVQICDPLHIGQECKSTDFLFHIKIEGTSSGIVKTTSHIRGMKYKSYLLFFVNSDFNDNLLIKCDYFTNFSNTKKNIFYIFELYDSFCEIYQGFVNVKMHYTAKQKKNSHE